jgi:arabinosaccharide transport system substrate-binding protein
MPGTLTRRRAILAAGTTGAAMVLAACGAGGGPSSPPSALMASQKSATLEAWFHSDNRYPWQQKALEDYNKEKGTDLKINFTKIGSSSEVADKLVVTLAAGSGFPDLCDIEISQIGKLLKTVPPFVPFNDALRGKQGDFFLPSFVDPWSDQGKWYSLGNELNAVLLAYRWDLFERAGVKAPLKTWDDVVEAGKRLVGAGVTNGIFFFGNGTTGAVHILSIIEGGGYTDKNGKLTITHPANARAIQYLSDLVIKHKVAAFDPSTDERMAAANAGLIGGDLGPSWRIASLDYKNKAPDTNGKWMVQHLPQWSGSGKTTTTWGGTGMTVMKDSKYKEIGQDFVVWEHVTPKAILHDYELRQVYPTNKKAFDDPRLNEPVPWFNNQKLGPILKEAADAMLPFFQGKWWPEISQGAGKHVTAALKGEKPVKQALDDAMADVKAAIEAAGGRVDPDGTIRS